MSELLLRARDVRCVVDQISILNGVDFDLFGGELVGLIGANGAGKTTLLKAVSGLWPGMTGDVELLGKPLERWHTREIAQKVAHVPQSTRVEFAFNAREVVLMGRSPHLGRFEMESAHDRATADQAMRITHTSHVADRLVYTLSGGEQQRVMIARALTQQPRVLLLDEPTSNLDIKHQMSILNLTRALAHDQGLGVIAAIHDLGLAARFCDRILMMSCGRIVADGRPEEVMTPERIADVFEIEAQLYRDPFTGHLSLSVKE